ncbi:hypothetical protein ACFLZM_05400 [Thermodesulfobacteriota bacterium]
MEVKRFYTIITILSLIVICPLLYSLSGEITELSKKASGLKIGMSGASVISLLDRATWAVIPGNEGDLALPDPRIKLELYWQNTPCTPVIAQFNSAHRVTGWDEGRALCGEDAHLFEPSDEYSAKKRRA